MIERKMFHVLLDPEEPGDATEYTVEVRGADQLRAELEGKRRGVHIKDAMHTTYLWAWAAMIREGNLDPKTSFTAFMERAVQVEGDADSATPVDPTQPDLGDDSP
jgi:hypothetical protein